MTSKSGMHIGLWSDEEDAQSAMREDNGYMIGRVVCGSAYDTLAAECDTLAKQAEDCARTCAEQAEEIRTLTGQLAEARGTLDRIDVIAEVADAAPLCMGEIRELIKMNRALKSEPAPQPKSKAVPLSAPVEVCGICDIAGCHHTRELNEKMPNEIAAWPTFPDGCVTGSWSANQHHQDAVAYVRKEPAPGHLDDECKRCGSVGGFGCYECTPAPRQSVQEAARVLLEWTGDYIPTVPKLAAVKAHLAHDNKTQPVAISAAWIAALQAIAQEAQGDE
ncbi:conserved hypothetical protein [Ruegeria sp. TrichCH4B]|nr:conserved hypothetical protein [Ruegeria sp. TrichCH4B]